MNFVNDVNDVNYIFITIRMCVIIYTIRICSIINVKIPLTRLTLGVDVEKRLFLSGGKPFWVDVCLNFYTSMCYFLIFGGF